MERLRGKTALVTGSTDGVGRLVARKLGQAGARVLVHGRDAERGARVVADIEASGGAANFLAADLSAYLGEIVHKGQSHRGEHPPIIDQPLWEAVQAQLVGHTPSTTQAPARASRACSPGCYLIATETA